MDDMPLHRQVSAMLDRQIAWMRTVMRDLQEVESGRNEAALEQMVALQKMREEELAALLREQEVLLAEWRTAQGIPAAERERIRRMAESAANLAEKIGNCYDRAVAWANAEMKQCSEAMGSLRRGRDMLARYRPGMDETPGFIDRKA